MLLPNQKLDAKRRIVQYQASVDADFCNRQAKFWIAKKARLQLEFIAENSELAPSSSTPEIFSEILNADNLETLRGLEGALAKQYFELWQKILPPSLNFTGRNRRPPKDPFNVILSLGYTLLHFEAVRYIHLLGLDPAIGFLHSLSHGRESLASDLIEGLRPQYDRFAYKLFCEKIIRVEHFSKKNDACFLCKAGRIAFYQEIQNFFDEIERPLREDGQLLLKRLQTFFKADENDFKVEFLDWK